MTQTKAQTQSSAPIVVPPHSYAEASAAGSLSTLVYRSRAAHPFSQAELLGIARTAQSRNHAEAITGVLLYDDRCFFQWLEGPDDGVARVMKSIEGDSRHSNIEILCQRSARTRIFANWGMKLALRSAPALARSPDVVETPSETIEALRRRPEIAAAVLTQLAPEPANRSTAPTAVLLEAFIRAKVLPGLAASHKATRHAALAPRPSSRVDRLTALLLDNRPDEAARMIQDLNPFGRALLPFHASLFEPAARRLGDMWADDDCSEFDVTAGLCRLQTAIRLASAEHPAWRPLQAPARTVLIAPQPGELHGLSAALASDVFWDAGWAPQCEYPASDEALQDMVSDSRFDALDLSLSAAFSRTHLLARMAETIVLARRASRNKAMVVSVGGRVFAEHDAEPADVGADVPSAARAGSMAA